MSVPGLVETNQTSSISKVIQKPIFLYALGLIAFGLCAFLIWQLYILLYLVNNPPSEKGFYACSPEATCVVYPKESISQICPITFKTETCNNACSDPINLCNQ